MWSGQRTAWSQASRITQEPIATIRPVSSATGMNSTGDTSPRVGMAPAQQRLERADAVLLEVEQRLVEKFELAALDREAQVGFELAANLRALVEAFLEEGEGAASRLLGAVQSEVGIAQQHLAVGAVVRRDGDPDAGRGHHLIAVDDERPGDRFEDVLGEPVDGVAVAADGLEDDELVAAQARDEMAAGGLEQALPGLDQQSVAGGVAERVVDDLELVEIEAVERKQAAVALGRAKQMVELLLEHGAVGETGEYVVECELGDALLALGDLADHFVEAGCEPGKLVLPANADLDMLARSKPPGGVVETRQRLGNPARRAPRRECRDKQAEQRHDGKRKL